MTINEFIALTISTISKSRIRWLLKYVITTNLIMSFFIINLIQYTYNYQLIADNYIHVMIDFNL